VTFGNGNGASEGAGQLQLFEALLELIEALSTRAPVILLLEDIHWADGSTRAFIAFLARSLRRERVLLLLTYRTDELHRRHPLRPLLTELDRLERTRRIELSPWDRAELAEVLADLLGDAADELLLDRLLLRTEGNPLYVEELLAAGLDGRGAPPQSLNDAFMLRIERLPAEARATARAVAVGGRVDEPTLAALTGLSDDALRETLRAAIAENVLLAGDDDRYRFRHALLREAVYDDLLPGERGDLHRATALALEARELPACIEDEVERVAQIATHYAAAGDQPAALRATIAAAKSARRVHAYADVADLLERALELWSRVPDAEAIAGMQQLELLAEAATVHGMAGDWARAEALQLRALELAGDDLRARSRLLSGLAQTQWKLNRGREGLDTAQQALALMPADETDADRAELLAFLARTRVLRGQFRNAIADGELALAAATAAGNRRTVGQVLNTLGMARIAIGEVAQGEAQLREAMEVANEVGDADALAVAVCNLGDLLALAGRTRDALNVIKEAITTTPQTLRRTFSWMRLTLTVLAFEVGDWELARSDQGPARSALSGTVLIFRYTRDAELALGFGHEEEAEAALAAAEPLVRVNAEAQWHGLYGSLLAELRRRQGDLAAARAAVMRALDELEVCTEDVMRIARVTAVGIAVEADQALRARDLRDTEAERDALLRAGIHLDRLEAAASDGGPVERAWLAIGRAESARAAGRSKPALWAAAAAEFDALERPYPAATARWRQAEALVERDDRDSAAAVARDALAVARELGAGWLEDELSALAARARLQVDAGTPGGGAAAEPEAETPFGLTPRELQVLSLIADGATNRQIGAALFMAEKTASVHVSRILAKLGVQSRTQAAAVAHRLHLPALAGPPATDMSRHASL
jgi:DNA-binding CsgD family transcriptional regulator